MLHHPWQYPLIRDLNYGWIEQTGNFSCNKLREGSSREFNKKILKNTVLLNVHFRPTNPLLRICGEISDTSLPVLL